MKKNLWKQITAVILAIFMAFTFVACTAPQPSNNPKNGARRIVDVEKTAYASADQSDVINVAHYEGESEILLIEIDIRIKI